MSIQKKIKNILSRLLALENGGGSQSSIIELHPTIQYGGDMEFDDAEVSALKSAILGGKKVSVHLVMCIQEGVEERVTANRIVSNQETGSFAIVFLHSGDNYISKLQLEYESDGGLSAYTSQIGYQS